MGPLYPPDWTFQRAGKIVLCQKRMSVQPAVTDLPRSRTHFKLCSLGCHCSDITMLNKIIEKIDDWLSVWGDIVFHPKKFFSTSNSNPPVSAFEFFTGSLILSYALTFLVSALYFLLFYRLTFLSKIEPEIALTLVSKLFIAYLVTFLSGFLIAGAVSFFVAVMFGSKARFIEHLRMLFQLSALEPAASIASTIMFLSDLSATWLAVLCFASARSWALYSGYWGIQQVHRSSRSSTFVYLVGFLPSWTILTAAIAALVWMMLAMGIVPWWD